MLCSLLFRVEEYIKEVRDQNIVDPDPDSVYSKRKERLDETKDDNSGICATQIPLSFSSDGWSADIRRMPFFTRAEMNLHISKSGERIDPTSKAHSIPTSIRNATTFLNDEYFKSISAASDENYFYFRSHCYHSIFSGEVKHASCSCVAGKVGFCNHILALLMKICKFSLYECKTVHELENEEDMQPKQACTSSLQQWYRKGRGSSINPQPTWSRPVHQHKILVSEVHFMRQGIISGGKRQMKRNYWQPRKNWTQIWP